MTNRRIAVTVDADLEPIVPRFMELRRLDIAIIAESLTKNDLETIRRLGHSMKGSGAGYGFDEITEIGRAIEEAAKTGNTGEIARQQERLGDYLDNVEVTYG